MDALGLVGSGRISPVCDGPVASWQRLKDMLGGFGLQRDVLDAEAFAKHGLQTGEHRLPLRNFFQHHVRRKCNAFGRQ